MPDDWAFQFTARAMARVDAFVDANPEYTYQGVPQPGQGSTNRVVFARCGRELAVLKVFCETERRHGRSLLSATGVTRVLSHG